VFVPLINVFFVPTYLLLANYDNNNKKIWGSQSRGVKHTPGWCVKQSRRHKANKTHIDKQYMCKRMYVCVCVCVERERAWVKTLLIAAGTVRIPQLPQLDIFSFMWVSPRQKNVSFVFVQSNKTQFICWLYKTIMDDWMSGFRFVPTHNLKWLHHLVWILKTTRLLCFTN
jgi:hypothetical protein